MDIGRMAHGFFHVVGLERAVPHLEARLVEHQVLLLPRRVPGERRVRGSGCDRVDPVAHEPGEGDEDFVDLFPPHALHRITPDIFHPAQHRILLRPRLSMSVSAPKRPGGDAGGGDCTRPSVWL